MVKHEQLDSAIAYGTAGGGAALVSSLDVIAGPAASLTIVLSCVVVIVRLVYDVTRLVRYLRDKDKT